LQRALFSKDSAYRSETGGLMEALRQLDAQSIRDYHASAYLPHNLTLIVAGRSLSPTRLLETLQSEVEPSIIAHKQNKGPKPVGWKRPFVDSTTADVRPFIAEDKVEIVEFPERDESVGEVMMSWIGVGALDFIGDVSLEVLGEYLTESAVSPLYAEFVEIEEPLCTDITFHASNQDPSILTVYLSSVPAANLHSIEVTFKAALARIAKEGIDMKRMETIIERQRLQLLESIETDAADTLSQGVLTDALFGNENGSDLGPMMATMSQYDVVGAWSSTEWVTLLSKFVLFFLFSGFHNF
jgi:Zn-dependent M16 (insulinase) family peptidase